MDLQQRVALLTRLGKYMLSDDESWKAVKEKAFYENGWFTPSFVDLATKNIADRYLQHDSLNAWTAKYKIPEENNNPSKVGIVMAGNIPLVGFHDFLCAFITGHVQTIKLSSKDSVLLKHLAEMLAVWEPETRDLIRFAGMLKGCDAYIATGSNNTARYFEYYFARFPHIIRRNRTSVAILTGNENEQDLSLLADDVYQYFGLGCRNVTKLYVPKGYDFIQLLDNFRKYNELADHHKYKNNYDYQLAILIVNKLYYMTNGSVILVEDPGIFSPISRLNFEFYSDAARVTEYLKGNPEIQAVVGNDFVPFGNAQQPTLEDFADGMNTMNFFLEL
ncbi:MAG TPA: hypothetical protein VM012_03305 [Flavitalea sp.]|nr:hypothetical protein [Flavitalea sp.]